VIVGGGVLTRDLQDYDYDNDRGGDAAKSSSHEDLFALSMILDEVIYVI